MSQTKEFTMWMKLESSRLMVSKEEKARREALIESTVDQMMREENLKIEMKDHNGKWIDYFEEPIQ